MAQNDDEVGVQRCLLALETELYRFALVVGELYPGCKAEVVGELVAAEGLCGEAKTAGK